MGVVDKWPSRMQGQWFFRSRASEQQFSVGSRKSNGRLPVPEYSSPKKVSIYIHHWQTTEIAENKTEGKLGQIKKPLNPNWRSQNSTSNSLQSQSSSMRSGNSPGGLQVIVTNNYGLSKSRLIHEFWTKWNFICALLSSDRMIDMTATAPGCGLHLLLEHVLVACTLCHLWKYTYLEKKVDHISFQSMYNWNFHHILRVSSFEWYVVQCVGLNRAENTLTSITSFGQTFCPYLL